MKFPEVECWLISKRSLTCLSSWPTSRSWPPISVASLLLVLIKGDGSFPRWSQHRQSRCGLDTSTYEVSMSCARPSRQMRKIESFHPPYVAQARPWTLARLNNGRLNGANQCISSRTRRIQVYRQPCSRSCSCTISKPIDSLRSTVYTVCRTCRDVEGSASDQHQADQAAVHTTEFTTPRPRSPTCEILTMMSLRYFLSEDDSQSGFSERDHQLS